MNRLKELRERNHMNQQELAVKLQVAQSTISSWETGRTEMENRALIKTANLFGVSVDYLLNNESVSAQTASHWITVPKPNVREISPKGILPLSVIKSNDYICLTVIGSSMEPAMFEGDIVIVKKQDNFKTDDIVVMCVNDKIRALQQLTKYEDGIVLKSFAPLCRLFRYDNSQLKSRVVTITGKVVELRRRYNYRKNPTDENAND